MSGRAHAPATGERLPTTRVTIGRADVIRYAGASNDFNPLHWSDRSARAAGLPGVIAHGMLTMGIVARAVTDWWGDAAAVLEYGVRFSRPVVVPDDGEGVVLVIDGEVEAVEGREARVSLRAAVAGEEVLTKASMRLRLPGPDAGGAK